MKDYDDEVKSDDEEILEAARDRYNEAMTEWDDVRKIALDDMKFGRGSDQWDEQAKRARTGRPMYTMNLLPSFIRQVVNDARQNKPNIRVRPVDSTADPATAEVMNGLIRHIEAISHADIAYDTAIDNAASCGFGFLVIDIDYVHDDTFDMDIKVRRVANPFSIVFDPLSTAADGSDWRFAFEIQEFAKADFKKRWPDAECEEFEGDDIKMPWITAETVRVAKYWARDEVEREVLQLENGMVVDAETYAEMMGQPGAVGVSNSRKVKGWKVIHRIITGREVLETVEWPGRYIPISPCFGDEINIEGKRKFHSLFHDAKDAQRIYNYYQSAAVEMTALNPKVPWIGKKGAFDNSPEKWSTANVISHSYLEWEGDTPPVRAPSSNLPAAELQMSLVGNENIKRIIGIQDAGLGVKAQGGVESGVTVKRRKIESDTATFHFIDNLTRCIRFAGEIMVDLIPKVYNQARIIRVLGEDGTSKLAAVGPNGQPGPPEFKHVYDLTAGKYDLIVNAGPSYTTRREEASAEMGEFLRNAPQVAGIVMDLMLKNLDWPGADEMAQRIKGTMPPHIIDPNQPAPPPPPDPEMAKAQAQTAEAQARFQLDQQIAAANAQLEQQTLEVQTKIKMDADASANEQKLVLEIDRLEKAHQLKIAELNLEAELRLKELQAESDLALIKYQMEASVAKFQPQGQSGGVNLKRPE